MPLASDAAIFRGRARPFDSHFVLLIRLSREELVPPECIISIPGGGVVHRVRAIGAFGRQVVMDCRGARVGLHRKLSDGRSMLSYVILDDVADRVEAVAVRLLRVDCFNLARMLLRSMRMLVL